MDKVVLQVNDIFPKRGKDVRNLCGLEFLI